MAESGTADELVSIVVSNKVVDADDPLPVSVAGGSGLGGPATIADGADVTQGAKADSAWNGSAASPTIMAVLKAIYAKVAATLGFSVGSGAVDATTLRVVNASDGPTVAVLGGTTDAAVDTDANGSINAHLRGLVKQIASALAGGTSALVTRQEVYTAPVSGELAGSASAVQMPSVACKMVRFKAEYDNVGRVYIGVSGVTKAAGTTTTTAGIQLNPGEDTGWIPVDNLSRFWRICDNAGDDLTYLALA